MVHIDIDQRKLNYSEKGKGRCTSKAMKNTFLKNKYFLNLLQPQHSFV